MTRIVAGAARGHRLRVPPGSATRPTSDRAREGLFSTAEALLGTLIGTRVLDLYAGSGAVGLEALSRGASAALLVERDPRAARVARGNADSVQGSLRGPVGGPVGGPLGGPLGGAVGEVSVRQEAVERLAAGSAPGAPYDLVFADPPYSMAAGDLRRVLAGLAEGGWLAPGALVVVERATRDSPWTWPEGFRADRERRYGEGTLWYGRAP